MKKIDITELKNFVPTLEEKCKKNKEEYDNAKAGAATLSGPAWVNRADLVIDLRSKMRGEEGVLETVIEVIKDVEKGIYKTWEELKKINIYKYDLAIMGLEK